MQTNNTNMGAVNWQRNSNNSKNSICLKQFLIPSDPIEETSYVSQEQDFEVSTMSMEDIMLTMDSKNLANAPKSPMSYEDRFKNDIMNAIDKNNNIDTSNEINWNSVGGGKLSEDEIDFLKDKYDVENMSNQDLYDLMADLTDKNIFSKDDVGELTNPSRDGIPDVICPIYECSGNEKRVVKSFSVDGFDYTFRLPITDEDSEYSDVIQVLLDRIKYHQEGIDNIDDVKFNHHYYGDTAHLTIKDDKADEQVSQKFNNELLQYHKDQLEVQTKLYNVLSQLKR